MHRFLLPHRFKAIGWVLLTASLIFGGICEVTGWQPHFRTLVVFPGTLDSRKTTGFEEMDMGLTIFGILFIVGALFIMWSKEKVEDEMIESIRLTSLLWAVSLNYGLLVFAFLMFYGTTFLQAMLYNLFTTLAIFIIRFHFQLYRSRRYAK